MIDQQAWVSWAGESHDRRADFVAAQWTWLRSGLRTWLTNGRRAWDSHSRRPGQMIGWQTWRMIDRQAWVSRDWQAGESRAWRDDFVAAGELDWWVAGGLAAIPPISHAEYQLARAGWRQTGTNKNEQNKTRWVGAAYSLFWSGLLSRCTQQGGTRNTQTRIQGVVDCFFSRLDCVYGVQSNMFMLRFFKKRIIFHIIYLYSTPLCPFSDKRLDLFPVFMKPSLDGLRLVSWLSVLWLAKPPLVCV